jgi:hypothetical protein
MEIQLQISTTPKNRRVLHIFFESCEYKKCCTCKSWKLLDNFGISRREWDVKAKTCINCNNIKYLKNKVIINKKRLDYQRKNKDKVNLYRRQRRLDENDSVNAYFKKYHTDRIVKDPIYKLSKNIRRLIQRGFENKQLIRSSKTKEILGVENWKQLYDHLIITFYNNYGEVYEHGKYVVHIDHKIPVSFAKSENDLIKLNHYSNLQFLKAEDNLKKGNRIKYVCS